MQTAVYYQPAALGDLSQQAHALLAQICGFSDEMICGPHGKPFFAEHPHVHFSLTHTHGMVACAISDLPVGVDVEHRRSIRPALAARCFTPRERAWAGTDQDKLLALWTRKEAYLKCTGEGITRSLREIETLDRTDLSTVWISGNFVISICGMFDSAQVQIRPVQSRK